jgi:PhnB protein
MIIGICTISRLKADVMTATKQTYRTVTPYLVVSDADAELAFLKEAFGGAEVECHRNEDGSVMHAEIRIGDSLVMLGQAGGQWQPHAAALYLWIEDVDATYAKALAAGAASESAPDDKPYGHRTAGVIDRNGVTWWIGAPVAARRC